MQELGAEKVFVDKASGKNVNRPQLNEMLAFARRDMYALGIARLYLITDHTQFYERCGWKFLCPVTDDEGIAMRIYTAPTLPV